MYGAELHGLQIVPIHHARYCMKREANPSLIEDVVVGSRRFPGSSPTGISGSIELEAGESLLVRVMSNLSEAKAPAERMPYKVRTMLRRYLSEAG